MLWSGNSEPGETKLPRRRSSNISYPNGTSKKVGLFPFLSNKNLAKDVEKILTLAGKKKAGMADNLCCSPSSPGSLGGTPV